MKEFKFQKYIMSEVAVRSFLLISHQTSKNIFYFLFIYLQFVCLLRCKELIAPDKNQATHKDISRTYNLKFKRSSLLAG